MEKELLMAKLEYFFSAFCVSFFESTRELVEKFNYAVPIDELPGAIKNFTFTQEELVGAVAQSQYLKIEDSKLVVPRPENPYELAVVASALPKCFPSYRFRALIKELLAVDAYVYDFTLYKSLEQMSFMVKFDNNADMEKFKSYYKHLTYESLAKDNYNSYHEAMKHLKNIYEKFDKTKPIESYAKYNQQIRKWLFWTEVTPEIIEFHKQGVELFEKTKQFRREHHVSDYRLKHYNEGTLPQNDAAKSQNGKKLKTVLASRFHK